MLEIELEEQGKFSLFFGGHHCHYCADAEEYARLSGDIQAILETGYVQLLFVTAISSGWDQGW